MSTKHFIIPFVVLLATARTTHADAVADFKTGTAVALTSATVDLTGGSRASSGSRVIEKRGGSLDFDIQASDLGVSLPITLHLRGRVLGGGSIAFDIDQAYSPRIELGGGHWLSRVTGRLYMLALPLPGTAKHSVGNVRLQIARASSVTAYGDWASMVIAIRRLDLLGGVAQPELDGFWDPNRTLLCSSKVAAKRTLSLSLADVATANGAVVQLKNPRDAGVRVPSGVRVRAGRRSATVTARIEPNFVGTVRLTAAAGGVARSIDVVVHPQADCLFR